MKRITYFLLIFVLFFALVSCGDDQDSGSGEVTEYELLGGQTMVFYVGQTGQFAEGFTYATKDTDVIELTGNSYRTLKEGSAVIEVSKGSNQIGVYVIAVYGIKQSRT